MNPRPLIPRTTSPNHGAEITVAIADLLGADDKLESEAYLIQISLLAQLSSAQSPHTHFNFNRFELCHIYVNGWENMKGTYRN